MSEHINKPAAWLHCERPEADVITDKVKYVWGETAVGSMANYSIPLYAGGAMQERIAALEKVAEVAVDVHKYVFGNELRAALREAGYLKGEG